QIIASFLNWGLLGVLVTQTYGYYLAFPKDRLLAMTLVYGMLVLETMQTALVSHDVFVAFASQFGDSAAIDSIRNHWFSIPVCGGISGGIVEFFFAYRIWIMSEKNSRGAPLIICTLALASIVSALISARAFFHARKFSTLLNNDDNSGSFASSQVWNGVGAVCDISISLCMPYYLMRHGTGLRQTHIMIVKLVRLLIETGGLTAIFAILHLCLYFANASAFIVPGLTVSKIYANTMLFILNNRMRIVDGRLKSEDEVTLDSPSQLFTDPTRTSGSGGGRPRNTSTVMVSNDRLVIRLHDIQRTNSHVPRNSEHDTIRQDDRRRKSAEGDESSIETRNSPNVMV
ncbi:hypothetical protein CVT25_008140, partial [Psilocybe cyanescens]